MVQRLVLATSMCTVTGTGGGLTDETCTSHALTMVNEHNYTTRQVARASCTHTQSLASTKPVATMGDCWSAMHPMGVTYTEIRDMRIVLEETLPSVSRFQKPYPWLPIATQSAALVVAISRSRVAGSPSTTLCSIMT